MNDPVQAFREAIIAALGFAPELIEPGRLQRFATSDRRGDAAGWCKLFDDRVGGVFGDFRTGVSETWVAADRSPMTREQRRARAENARRVARLRAECVPVTSGDAVSIYMRNRGLRGLWPLPECLRLHLALPYWHGGEQIGTFPAMVAPLLGSDGRMLALHRTYLTLAGHKADVPSPKKLTGASGPLAGASIPLGRPNRGVIGIAEGIETALSAMCASSVPTVAAFSAGNLAAWRWPTATKRVVIFADHDQSGLESSAALRARVLAAGLRCEVLTPTTQGADWCDVWASRDVVSIGGSTT